MKNIEKYLKHLQNCNIMQDWSEAEMALADTPESLKDESWHLAYNEMREKMKTCTCGLKEIVSSLKESQQAELKPLDEDEIDETRLGLEGEETWLP